MPQLNIETFVTQYFWLIVILFGFYVIVVTTIIPSIASSLKLRKKLTVSENAEVVAGLDNSVASEDSSWSSLLNVSHEIWSSSDLKSLHFSNANWIKNNQ
jgi:hypothetical protein